MEILTKENLVKAKTTPAAISRTSALLVSYSAFSSPTQNQIKNHQTLESGVESGS